MLTTTAMASATAKNEKRVTLVFIAAVALIIGAASVSVYSQMGGTYVAPTLATDLPYPSELSSEINRLRIRVATVHFPPYLAANLHELSVRLAEAGDNVGALKAIGNAVSIRRHLAQGNPARYATSLELSLQLLSQLESTREASGMKTEETVVRQMKARLADLGGMTLAGWSVDFGELVAEKAEKRAKVVKVAGLKPE